MSDEHEWQTDPVKKFGDFSSPQTRAKRNLPPSGLKYRQNEETEEIRMRREVDQQFRVKRTK